MHAVHVCLFTLFLRYVRGLPFVIFQLKVRIEKKTSISIQNSSVMLQTIPTLVTGTGFPNANVYSSQGRGNLQTENMKEK